MIRGKVLRLGDNVDTDVILPGKYMVLTDPKELSKHALEPLDQHFADKAKNGVIIVGGSNFGCGSSREQAPIALKYAGVRCVIAKSFARIFYRNAVNIGLPVLECELALESFEEGDDLTTDLKEGIVKNQTKGVTLKVLPIPAFMLEILSDGGLVENLRRKM
jgi:3-isopropylmalate/(R)-2-methylmalate dehydratase small subunit